MFAVGGLACDDVEVVDDGDAAQVEQVFAGTGVAGAAALPVADVGERVLDLDTLAELGPPGRGLLALVQLGEQCLVGWMATLRPLRLVVHRSRSGQAAQVPLGKCTVWPARKPMLIPAGQVSCPAVKSRVNWPLAKRPPVLRTRQALQ
jgi:hypothetical protein